MSQPNMSREYFYGTTRTRLPVAGSGKFRPADLRGTRATGRIVKLFIGQSHGCIRVANRRDVFFHRADVAEDTAFNELHIGDAVTFELFEDPISGARALHVARRVRSR
jgi:cold shock CspA family protein